MANILTKAINGLLGRNTNALQAQQAMMDQYFKQWLEARVTWMPNYPLYPKMDQHEAVTEGYASSADVYSIISRKARMASSIPFYVYRIKGKDGKKWLREYKAIMNSGQVTEKSLQKALSFKAKAMEEVEDKHPLNVLLENPNPDQSQADFLEYCYGFLDITGNTFMYKERLNMGANEGKVRSLCTLPSQWMKIIPDGMFPLGIAGYVMYLWGEYGIDKEDIIHVKYFNPDYQADGSHLYGMSPLQAGNKTLERSNSAVDSSTAQFQHGGPAGMVYNESMTPDEQNNVQMGKMKQLWNKEIEGDKNRGKVFFSAGKLGYIQTGLSPVDLKILESEMYTFRQLCRIYHMPSAIFNDNEHATMANMEQFYKAAYTDAIIPMVVKMGDALNRSLLPDFTGDGDLIIEADYSNIAVLQQDMKATAEWCNTAWWLTPDEKREVMKWGPTGQPAMQLYYIPSGFTPINDLSMEPEDITAEIDELNKSGLNPYNK